jgi:hypothetical protein
MQLEVYDVHRRLNGHSDVALYPVILQHRSNCHRQQAHTELKNNNGQSRDRVNRDLANQQANNLFFGPVYRNNVYVYYGERSHHDAQTALFWLLAI